MTKTKLSPAMRRVVDAMRNGAELAEVWAWMGNHRHCELSHHDRTAERVSWATVNALKARGVIEWGEPNGVPGRHPYQLTTKWREENRA